MAKNDHLLLLVMAIIFGAVAWPLFGGNTLVFNGGNALVLQDVFCRLAAPGQPVGVCHGSNDTIHFNGGNGVKFLINSLNNTVTANFTGNTANYVFSSVGAGSQVYQNTAGLAVTFRSLIGTGGITTTQNLNDVTLSLGIKVNNQTCPGGQTFTAFGNKTGFTCTAVSTGVTSINGDNTAAQLIVGQTGNTTASTVAGTTTIGLGVNPVITGGSVQTITKGLTIDLLTLGGDENANSHKITSLATPTLTGDAQNANHLGLLGTLTSGALCANNQVLKYQTSNSTWICSSSVGAAITSINGDTTGAQTLAGTTGNVTITDAGATHTFNTGSNIVTTGLSAQTITKQLITNSLKLGGNEDANSYKITNLNNATSPNDAVNARRLGLLGNMTYGNKCSDAQILQYQLSNQTWVCATNSVITTNINYPTDLTIYSVGGIIYEKNSTNSIIISNAKPEVVLADAVARKGNIYIASSLAFSPTFSGIDIPSSTNIILSSKITLYTPNGYTGYMFRFPSNTYYSTLNCNMAQLQDATGLATAIVVQGGSTGTYRNTIENCYTNLFHVHRLYNSTGSNWANVNTEYNNFMNVGTANRGYDFNATVLGPGGGFNRNHFIDNTVELNALPNAIGFNNICCIANEFYGDIAYDVGVGGHTAIINSTASQTQIYGGIMTGPTFVDNGTGTWVSDGTIGNKILLGIRSGNPNILAPGLTFFDTSISLLKYITNTGAVKVVVDSGTSQALQNKVLFTNNVLVDKIDTSKVLKFDISKFLPSHTNNLIFPNANSTLLANTSKLMDLSDVGGQPCTNGWLLTWQSSNSTWVCSSTSAGITSINGDSTAAQLLQGTSLQSNLTISTSGGTTTFKLGQSVPVLNATQTWLNPQNMGANASRAMLNLQGSQPSNIKVGDLWCTGGVCRYSPGAGTGYTIATISASQSWAAGIVHTMNGILDVKTTLRVPSGTLLIRNPTSTFGTSIANSAQVANNTLTIPIFSGIDTLPVLGIKNNYTKSELNIGSNNTFTHVNSIGFTSQLADSSHLVRGLVISNPADSFGYQIIGSAITHNRTLTLPLVSQNETLLSNSSKLMDLSDVGGQPCTNGWLLTWQSSNSTWVCAAGSGGGITSINADVTSAQLLKGTSKQANLTITDNGGTHNFNIGQSVVITNGTAQTFTKKITTTPTATTAGFNIITSSSDITSPRQGDIRIAGTNMKYNDNSNNTQMIASLNVTQTWNSVQNMGANASRAMLNLQGSTPTNIKQGDIWCIGGVCRFAPSNGNTNTISTISNGQTWAAGITNIYSGTWRFTGPGNDIFANGTAVIAGKSNAVTILSQTQTSNASAIFLKLPSTNNYFAFQPRYNFTSPANQTGTTSATPVMLGAFATYTPRYSGNATATISGYASSSLLGDGCRIDVRQSSTYMGLNGAALTGTLVGTNQKMTAGTGSELLPFSKSVTITGLTTGTKYFIDLSFAALTGGTCTIYNTDWQVREQ